MEEKQKHLNIPGLFPIKTPKINTNIFNRNGIAESTFIVISMNSGEWERKAIMATYNFSVAKFQLNNKVDETLSCGSSVLLVFDGRRITKKLFSRNAYC